MDEGFKKARDEWIASPYRSFTNEEIPGLKLIADWVYEWCSKRMVPQKLHQEAWGVINKHFNDNSEYAADAMRSVTIKKQQAKLDVAVEALEKFTQPYTSNNKTKDAKEALKKIKEE